MYKTWVEISASALRSNIDAITSLTGRDIQFCSVVKSNAYGHGASLISKIAYDHGIRIFAVDSLDEAREIAPLVPKANIFILGYTPPDQLAKVVENGFIQTVYSQDIFKELTICAQNLLKKARINLKVETGTNRQGIDEKNLQTFIRLSKKYSDCIEIVGVSSHFANAEDVHNPVFTHYQIDRFKDYLDALSQSSINPPCIHLACSAAAIQFPEALFSMARIGIAQYGLWSSDSLRRITKLGAKNIDLTPVLSWKTRIAQIKDVIAGDSIGYNLRFVADRPMRIAILPIGYYDGYKRQMQGKSHVLIQGHKCRVLGNICMNMCMVDISPLPQIKEHTEVTLLGRDGMHQISAEDIAAWCDTINYEAVTQIAQHIPRILV